MSGVMMVVMVVVVVVMMVPRGKRRTCKHHQEQGSSKNLLHAQNVARKNPPWGVPNRHAPNQKMGAPRLLIRTLHRRKLNPE